MIPALLLMIPGVGSTWTAHALINFGSRRHVDQYSLPLPRIMPVSMRQYQIAAPAIAMVSRMRKKIRVGMIACKMVGGYYCFG